MVNESGPQNTIWCPPPLSPTESLKAQGESTHSNVPLLRLTHRLPHACVPQERFVRLLKRSDLPSRQSPVYNVAVRQRHAAILGICALVDSYPYTVERWMPELLTSVLAEHTYDPVSCLSDVSTDEFADAHGLFNLYNRSRSRRRSASARAISRRRIRTPGTRTRSGSPRTS